MGEVRGTWRRRNAGDGEADASGKGRWGVTASINVGNGASPILKEVLLRNHNDHILIYTGACTYGKRYSAKTE